MLVQGGRTKGLLPTESLMIIARDAFKTKSSVRSALRRYRGSHDCGGRALPAEKEEVETCTQWIRKAGGQEDSDDGGADTLPTQLRFDLAQLRVDDDDSDNEMDENRQLLLQAFESQVEEASVMNSILTEALKKDAWTVDEEALHDGDMWQEADDTALLQDIIEEEDDGLEWLPDIDPCAHLELTEPLIDGDTGEDAIKLGEAVCYLMELRISQAWSQASFDRFLQVMVMLLGGASRCRLPTSLHRMRTYLGVQSHMTHAVHVCPNWCRAFPKENDPRKWNEEEECGAVLERDSAGAVVRRCHEKRFEVTQTASGEKLRPREWFYYFDIKHTIRTWMQDVEFCKARARRDARLQNDFWTSALAKSIDEHEDVDGSLLEEPIGVDTPAGGDPNVEYAEHRVMVVAHSLKSGGVFQKLLKFVAMHTKAPTGWALDVDMNPQYDAEFGKDSSPDAHSDGETPLAFATAVFVRMSLGGEVYTSAMYTRAVKRVSYHVSLLDHASGDLPTGLDVPSSERPYAKVLAYYLVTIPGTDKPICHLARMLAYREVEDAYYKKQGITVVDKHDSMELLLPCTYIGPKALFFEPKDGTHYHVVHLLRE
eukprot:gene10522-12452_t